MLGKDFRNHLLARLCGISHSRIWKGLLSRRMLQQTACALTGAWWFLQSQHPVWGPVGQAQVAGKAPKPVPKPGCLGGACPAPVAVGTVC